MTGEQPARGTRRRVGWAAFVYLAVVLWGSSGSSVWTSRSSSRRLAAAVHRMAADIDQRYL